VLIATGVYKARDIGGPRRRGLAGIVPALDYLTASNRGPGRHGADFDSGALDAAGKHVVVIGGGDTAMDCVRTAVRQGAKSVKCLYRRDRATCRARMREVKNAEEEGVEFVWLAAPRRSWATTRSGVRAMRMHLGVPDASGRQSPQTRSRAAISPLEADLVIKALGFDPGGLPRCSTRRRWRSAAGAPEGRPAHLDDLARRRVRRRRHRARRLAGRLGDPRRPRRRRRDRSAIWRRQRKAAFAAAEARESGARGTHHVPNREGLPERHDPNFRAELPKPMPPKPAATPTTRRQEHDACGVGLVARDRRQAAPRRGRGRHRGAESRLASRRGRCRRQDRRRRRHPYRDPAGLLRRAMSRAAATMHAAAPIAVGMVFLPRPTSTPGTLPQIVETEILLRLPIYGWRQVPVNVAVHRRKGQRHAARDRADHAVANARAASPPRGGVRARPLRDPPAHREAGDRRRRSRSFYICSLSCRSIIYKGMFLAEQPHDFYPDLLDPRFVSRFAIYHQRYSTNTFPTWRLAQPFRMLAHNGEINTVPATSTG
jgi:hypothetical protein